MTLDEVGTAIRAAAKDQRAFLYMLEHAGKQSADHAQRSFEAENKNNVSAALEHRAAAQALRNLIANVRQYRATLP